MTEKNNVLTKLSDRYNHLAHNKNYRCAYCDDCYSCEHFDEVTYAYVDRDGDTIDEYDEICENSDYEYYQPENEVDYWKILCERLRDENDDRLTIAHNKYMEVLLNNLDVK